MTRWCSRALPSTATSCSRPRRKGVNWIIEVDAPSGYDTAKPVQVRYPADSEAENCVQVGSRQRCTPDDDGSGGMLLVIIQDTPVELPPTDAETGSHAEAVRASEMTRRRHRGG